MNTDTPETNAAKRPSGLRACADGLDVNPDKDFAQKCMRHAADRMEQLERERDEVLEQVQQLNHQLARSQEAGTIWYRRCFSEDAEWNLGELTKLTEERDELRDMLQEEQRLHIQTLNERDEARQWESQALVARIQRDEWKAKYIQQGFPAIQNKRSPCRPRCMEGGSL